MLGKTISHYRIDQQLGRGGMGVVYLATDISLRRQVAIKFATGSREQDVDSNLLTGEARAASRLTHPNIARIYDLGETEDRQTFFVMEYVPGRNLSDLIDDGPLGIEQCLDILRAAASALSEAHRHGIVHRDIKPGNIRIGDDNVVKVLDFGLASRTLAAPGPEVEATVTANLTIPERSVVGTPGYMSPEQAAAQPLDSRSDLFSLGCVFYECLTGQRPFPARSVPECLFEVHRLVPPPPSSINPEVPKSIDLLTARLLAKDPAERFQSANEVLAALHTIERSRTGSPVTLLSRHRRTAAIATVLLLVAAGAYLFWRARPYQPRPEAVRWYQEGLDALRDGTYLKASKALSETVRLDPDFALAHAHLAEAWLEMDYGDRAKEEMIRAQRAGGSGARLPRVDRLHLEAVDFFVTGDFKESASRYREMLPLVQGPAQALVYLDLGRACERAGDYSCASDSFRQAARTDPQSAAAYLREGQLDRRARKYADAAKAYSSAEHLYQAASNIEGVTEVQYEQGALALDREQPAEAKDILDKALAGARLTGNTQQQVKILLQLATLGVQSGAADQVHALAEQAVELARSDGVENLVSRALITLGGAFFLKDKAEAEKYYSRALEIARRNHASGTEARALLSLGSLHSSMGEPQRAISELKPATAFFEQAGYVTDTFQARILLGRSQRDLGDFDGAAGVFRDLLRGAEKSGSREDRAFLHEAIGQVLFRKESYRAAVGEFDESYRLYSDLNSPTGVPYLLLDRAAALWRLGDYAAGAALLAQAESQAKSSGSADLANRVRIERLQLELSQLRFAQAREDTSALGRLDPPLNPGDKAVVAAAGALALAESGQPSESLRTCRDAIQASQSMHVEWILSVSLLYCSQAALAARDAEQALAWASQARQIFHRTGQLDSEWRAGAVMALAGAADALPAAKAALAGLERDWTHEDFERYLVRPDIKRLREQVTKREPIR